MKEKIKELLKESRENSDDREKIEFFNENLRGKDIDSIIGVLDKTIKDLANLQPDEIGGLTAISGFYFQFLVFIEYMIDTYNGKWDCIALELHDDIVAVKENNIKFVQVKTCKHVSMSVTDSPANKIYLRKKTKIGGIDRNYNSSWIDKLISKAKFFKKDEYNTKFELITNFIVTDSKTVSISEYKTENKVINCENDIFKKVNDKCYIYDTNGYKELNYEHEYGEKLNDLLSRFYINEKCIKLGNLDFYINCICRKIEKSLGGVYIDENDIYWVIGKLCDMCNIESGAMELIMSKDDVNNIFLQIHSNAMKIAEAQVDRHGNETIINNSHQSIHDKFKNLANYSQIKENLIKCKESLITWVNENGGINRVINRYFSASMYSTAINNMGTEQKIESVKNLILMPCILNLIYKADVKYINNNSLLINYIKNDLDCYISIMGVESGKLSRKIDGIKRSINDIEVAEMFNICINDELDILIQGYTDKKFIDTFNFKLDNKFELEEGLLQEDSMTDVFISVNLIPGELLKEELEELLDEDEWDDGLIDIWENFSREGEISDNN